MRSILLLTAAIEALTRGAELLTVLDNLSAVGRRLREDGAPDPTDEELDLVRGRIRDRQERMNVVR